jgi:hypothetical protein
MPGVNRSSSERDVAQCIWTVGEAQDARKWLLGSGYSAHQQLLLLHAPCAPGQVLQPGILLRVIPSAGGLRASETLDPKFASPRQVLIGKIGQLQVASRPTRFTEVQGSGSVQTP